MRRLTDRWQDGLDWRAQEGKLNAFDQFRGRSVGSICNFIHQRGGHFAALEAPDLLAEDVTSFFRSVRAPR